MPAYAVPDPEIVEDLRSLNGSRISSALDEISELGDRGIQYWRHLFLLREKGLALLAHGVPLEVIERLSPLMCKFGARSFGKVKKLLASKNQTRRFIGVELLPFFYKEFPESLEITVEFAFHRDHQTAFLAMEEVGNPQNREQMVPIILRYIDSADIWPTRNRPTWKDARLMSMARELHEIAPDNLEVTAFVQKFRNRMRSVNALRGEMILLTMLRLRLKDDPRSPSRVFSEEILETLSFMHQRGNWDEDVKKLASIFQLASYSNYPEILQFLVDNAPDKFLDGFVTALAKRREIFLPAVDFLGEGKTCAEQVAHLKRVLVEKQKAGSD